MTNRMRGSAAFRQYWFSEAGLSRFGDPSPVFDWLDSWELAGSSKRWKALDAPVETALCVILKILQRGELTPLPVESDSSLRKKFAATPQLNPSSLPIYPGPPAPWTHDFDSERERQFFEWFIAQMPEAASQIAPQAPFEWISPNPDFLGKRVDFLVWFAEGKSIVIEIDDPKKDQDLLALADKQARDAECSKQGVTVIRFENAEIDLSVHKSAKTQQLRDLIGDRISPQSLGANHAESHRALWLPLLCARIQIAIIEAIGEGLLEPNADVWRVRLEQDKDWAVGHAALAGLLPLMKNLEELYDCSIRPHRIEIYGQRKNQEARIWAWENTADTWSQPPAGTSPAHPENLCLRLLAPGARPRLCPSSSSSWIIGSTSSDSIVPRNLRFPRSPTKPIALATSSNVLARLLENLLGYKQFREHQEEVVRRTLAGKSSVVLLPTAAGKSLIYQLAGLLLPGSILIIAPLKSLMEDQNRALRSRGITIGSVAHVDLKDTASLRNLFEKAGFVFIAPERLRTVKFLKQLGDAKIGSRSPISLAAIDEAHCVSEWGHDFRSMYLNIGTTVRRVIDGNLCIPALTGTASHWVLTDVRREIGGGGAEAIIEARDMDRKELAFDFLSSGEGEVAKLAGLTQALRKISSEFGFADIGSLVNPHGEATASGIIFCRTKIQCQKVHDYLKQKHNVDSEVFHGKLRDSEKSDIQERFLRNETALLLSTKAFGMGIDKPNIRFIVHWNASPSIESWYQEVGRAGRDGQLALCISLVSTVNPDLRRVLEPDIDASVANARYKAWASKHYSAQYQDDLAGLLYFHFNNFRGIIEEVADSAAVWSALADKNSARPDITVEEVFGPPKDQHEREDFNTRFQKALHRLSCLELVSEFLMAGMAGYSVTKSPNLASPPVTDLKASVKRYVSRYDPLRADAAAERIAAADTPQQLVSNALSALINYTYEVVEKRRRFAISEAFRMFSAGLEKPDETRNEWIHTSVRAYLEANPFKDVLVQFVESEDGRWSAATFNSIACELRQGDPVMWDHALGWIQGEYPDHPGLSLLRSLVACRQGESPIQDFEQGIRLLSARARAEHLTDLDVSQILVTLCEEAAAADSPDVALLLSNIRQSFESPVLDRLVTRWAGRCRTPGCTFSPQKELSVWGSRLLAQDVLGRSLSTLQQLT